MADQALNELCRFYWRPIYAEVRRRGHQAVDAQDLTQDFFARMLRREVFGNADREKGRFRSYLLGALDHFLVDALRSRQAEKRGGRAEVVPFVDASSEAWFLQQPAYGSTPAERFDQNWAVVLMDRALEALRAEYHATGRAQIFAAVEPFLAAGLGDDGYGEVCAQAGLTPQAFAVAVHRVRRRFRHCVRQQVEMTVADSSETDAEMKHLFGV